jgi:hypothetical protein
VSTIAIDARERLVEIAKYIKVKLTERTSARNAISKRKRRNNHD